MDPILFAGLEGIVDEAIGNWLGPAFILGVAAFAIMFIKDRRWMQLVTFIAMAAIVGVLIFAGDSFFGQDKVFTKEAERVGKTLGQ